MNYYYYNKNITINNINFIKEKNFQKQKSFVKNEKKKVNIIRTSNNQEKGVKNSKNKKIKFSKNSIENAIHDIESEKIPIENLITGYEFYHKNQIICRYIQKKIDQNPKIAEILYPKIKDKFLKISLDSFGNYLIQKLIENIPIPILVDIFVNSISNNFLSMCLNPHGTRVLQRFLEMITSDQDTFRKVVCLIEENFYDIIINQNSTHIIIKLFSLVKFPNNSNLLNLLCDNIRLISTQKHSCFTLQKCYELVDTNQKEKILDSIANVSDLLFNDQYGNYIVQFALSHQNPQSNKIIVDKYMSDFPSKVFEKCSSNVFSKCLLHCDKETQSKIIETNCNSTIVKQLLFNQYGNYGKKINI